MGPGPEVLACFGASADPMPLPGGQGTAWRSGDVVLKPAGDPRVARWTADLYRDLDSLGPLSPLDPLDPWPARLDPGFRVPRPLSTVTGDGAAGDGAAGDLGGPGPGGRRLGGLAVAARRARFVGRRFPLLAPADRGEPGIPRRAG